MNRWMLILRVVAAASAALAARPMALHAAQSPGLPAGLTAADWQADLDVLTREIPRRVGGALSAAALESIDSAADDLRRRLPTLSADEVVVRLAAIVTIVGDPLTTLVWPRDWPRNGIETRWFGCNPHSVGPCELHVVSTSDTYRKAIAARVVAIDGMPIDEVHRRLARLIPSGISPGAGWTSSTALLQLPNVLHGLGVTRRASATGFTLQDSMDARSTIVVPAVPQALASRPSHRAQLHEPFARKRPNDPMWWAALPDSQSVYLALRGFPDSTVVNHVADGLLAFADRRRAERLVIDLRRNGGGDYQVLLARLIPALRQHPVFGVRGHLYALTGPGTLSSGAELAEALRTDAGAILVGLPTGTRAELAEDRSRLTLPRSHLVVFLTRESFVSGTAGPPSVPVDHREETTWEMFRAGRDPALEWVLAQPVTAVRRSP